MIYKKLKRREIITYFKENSNVKNEIFIEHIINLYEDCHIDIDTFSNKYKEISKRPNEDLEHLIGIYSFIAHLSIENDYEEILENAYKEIIKESIIKENSFSYLVDKSIYENTLEKIINELRM